MVAVAFKYQSTVPTTWIPWLQAEALCEWWHFLLLQAQLLWARKQEGVGMQCAHTWQAGNDRCVPTWHADTEDSNRAWQDEERCSNQDCTGEGAKWNSDNEPNEIQVADGNPQTQEDVLKLNKGTRIPLVPSQKGLRKCSVACSKKMFVRQEFSPALICQLLWSG